MVGPAFLQKLTALEDSASNISSIAGPILAGSIYALVSIPFFVVTEIVVEMIVIFLIFSMDFELTNKQMIEDSDQSDGNQSNWQLFKLGISYIVNHKNLSFIMIVVMLVNFFMTCLIIGQPFILIHYFHVSNFNYGLLSAVTSIGMIASGITLSFLPEVKKPVKYTFVFGLLFGVTISLMAVPVLLDNRFSLLALIVYALISLALGTMLSAVNIPISIYFKKYIPENYQGRVMTVSNVLGQFLNPVGLVIYGVIFDHAQAADIFFWSGLISMIIVLMYSSRLRGKAQKTTN